MKKRKIVCVWGGEKGGGERERGKKEIIGN